MNHETDPAPNSTLADRLNEARRLIREAAAQAADEVRNGPDNPNIKRVSASPRMFTMSSSELARTGNWTPHFHDWAAQYEEIAQIVEAQQFYKLNELLKTGRIGAGYNRTDFAPEVIERVRAILGDLANTQAAERGSEPDRPRIARPARP